MKSTFSLIFCVFIFNCGYAQKTKHNINPKAKAINDSAARVFQRASGDKEKLKKIFPLLDLAIKIDSYYYEAWSNKIALYGQLDQFEDEYKCLKTMQRLFPKSEDVMLQTGVLEHITGHTKEAMLSFSKLLEHYNNLLEKNKNNANTRGLLYNKGLALILLNRVQEGRTILMQLYNSEKDEYVKSGIAFYINSSRDEIIYDKIPGK